MKGLEGWHFVQADGRLRDSVKLAVSPHCGTKVYPGLTLRVSGRPVVDGWGLHASQHAANAVFHAPSLLVCRVRLSGVVVQAEREMAATERTVLWMADATRPVWEWACRCASSALHREIAAPRQPDPALWRAVQVRWDWLHGRATQNDIEDARGPARAVMRRALGITYRGGTNANGSRKSKPARRPPQPGHGCALMCAGLVIGDWRAASRRDDGWSETPVGRQEAALLDELLMKLAPSTSKTTEQGRHEQTSYQIAAT